jgi:hypothetical protein
MVLTVTMQANSRCRPVFRLTKNKWTRKCPGAGQ